MRWHAGAKDLSCVDVPVMAILKKYRELSSTSVSKAATLIRSSPDRASRLWLWLPFIKVKVSVWGSIGVRAHVCASACLGGSRDSFDKIRWHNHSVVSCARCGSCALVARASCVYVIDMLPQI